MYPIIDTHCHVYPDKIAVKASQGIGSFYNCDIACDGKVSTLIEEGKKAGICHHVITSVATTPHQVSSINNFISETVKQKPDLFTGLGSLHPDSDDLEGDVKNLIELGLVGVKLHPDTQGFKLDDYRCLKIYELCEKYNLSMLLHTGDKRYDFSNPNRLIPIIRTYDKLTVVAAHFGGWSLWEEAAEKLCGERVLVDSSSSLFWLTKEKSVAIIRKYGADKILFGTDYPMWNPTEEVERFLSLGLTEEENKKILYGNASKLYGITV